MPPLFYIIGAKMIRDEIMILEIGLQISPCHREPRARALMFDV